MPKTKGNYETILISDVSTLNSYDFKREDDLASYVYDNAELFIGDLYGDRVTKKYREKTIREYVGSFGFKGTTRGPRIDVYLEGIHSNYIIEVKNPKYKSENVPAIGQVLNYGRMCGTDRNKLIIVTSLFDIDTAHTIEAFELPIKYVYLDKQRQAVFVGSEQVGSR